ncbi:MAG TPA: base excision DNA repair protein [Acidisarcina sp.]
MKRSRSITSKLRRPSKRAALKLRAFYDALFASYGAQQWWPAQTPFEVVIGAYLTQNTSWRGVAQSIDRLRERGLLTAAGLRDVSEEELRSVIRPSGYMVRKAAALKAFVGWLDAGYGGDLARLAAETMPVARGKLLALPGVGPETADAILLYALGQPAMVVDEYLRRVVTRHRLVRDGALYDEIAELARMSFAGDEDASRLQHYNEFHALIVEVGKRHCGTRPRCGGCPLAGFQPRPRNLAAAQGRARATLTGRSTPSA